MAPAIPRAEQVLHDWFAEHYPQVVERYAPELQAELRAGEPDWAA